MKPTTGKNPAEKRRQTGTLDAGVGMCIRIHRKNAKVTLKGLAARLGITYQQLHKYETGVNRIAAGRLMEIAEVLDIPVASFFVGQSSFSFAKPSSPEAGSEVATDAGVTLQGHQLLVAFLRIKDPNKRKLALAFVRSLAEPEIP